ncbi:MAG TPA: hypothetical protein VE172_05655 [Stackebrandtia sp.]|jgi:DNA-directed RNA polymerase subunit RPC12/RpoP|uniref:hypothetical protein n=1 Tax=Stackebrandtia sp. TaxID=2023065 RepID=UPI002D4C2CA8|nr:hypothetical protein [Stackebrandtia sp.]HZE38280.1 hypothetical protein [Stackebrandtia sp.]
MTNQAATPHTYPCQSCGAHVEFAPGTGALRCPYCGHEQAVPQAPRQQVREHSWDELMSKPRRSVRESGTHHFVCRQCGAQTESDTLSSKCQFCAAPLVADTTDAELVAPEAVVPFALDRSKARDALRVWVKSRWFAPNRLKRVTEAESSKSTYLPHWTFDARTASSYVGARGTYYYVTETYTDNGQTRTRQVRRTAWSPASGQVARDFDDVLVLGTRRVAPEKLAELEPWALHQAAPYDPAYLAGHTSLRYDVEPEAGLTDAKDKMASVINRDCRDDIGGDEQRVDQVNTNYADVTYKLMLLPVWICCYLFAGKTWQVLINGVSGEVQGQRPYSVAKIVAAVVAGLAVAAAIITLIVLNKN